MSDAATLLVKNVTLLAMATIKKNNASMARTSMPIGNKIRN